MLCHSCDETAYTHIHTYIYFPLTRTISHTHTHTHSAQVQTQFVRAQTWGLGPLSIHQPVMMTMALDGLVRGGPLDGEVIGITGYDLFRCVLTSSG